jgi:formimidoylglutamate deiminase
MATIHAKQALLAGGWAKDVSISVEAGRITTLEPDSPAAPGDEHHNTVVADMPNLHSHAFQL